MDQWDQRRAEAVKEYNDKATALNEAKGEAAKERSQFFDKLAIGCGATIAAMVSFLGSSGSHILQPRFAMRWGLIALLVSICGAWFRNFRYPSYLSRVRMVELLKGAQSEHRARNEQVQRGYPVVDEIGRQVSIEEWTSQFHWKDGMYSDLIAENAAKEKWRRGEYRTAEFVSLISATVAAGLLVLIALRTF